MATWALLASVPLACERKQAAPAPSTGRAGRRAPRAYVGTPTLGETLVTLPSLRDVVSSRALVGARVRITGRCLPPERIRKLGAPRHAQNSWQLEADGVAVFVIGPVPPGCTRARPAAVLTITARVAEDTLPPIGDLPPAPRRYLVRIDADPE